LIDVGRFKVINDAYGHVVGDYALKSLSDAIVTCARDSDIVFRFGGEEFVIVLSNTDLDGATL
jgi:diguanylate cyclase (GGDEF)-like protein